eukprot:scaffold9978_cov117-Skeletonema_menzelii.AAC.4
MAPEYYIFSGREGEVIPRHVTHVRIDKSLKVVPACAFLEHPNIEEVECHDGVEKIEGCAFFYCPSLRRVIMPGVTIIERSAFFSCRALNEVECGKLEIIVEWAFGSCSSLSSVDLPSIKIVEKSAFTGCRNLTHANFGKYFESIGRGAIRGGAFAFCRSLERITLPLKDGVIADDNIFQGCVKLNSVELVGGVHETVAALLMEEWKNDMNKEIDTINRILPDTPSGTGVFDVGGKAQAIRTWIRSVLRKIVHCKAEHRRYLNEAAATLQSTLPLPNEDIVIKNIIPFLELPSYTFEGED